MWDTSGCQPAAIASELAANQPALFYWQPVGDYPADTYPMQLSVTDGVNSLIYLTTGEVVPGANVTVPGPTYPESGLVLIGYSQGAMVIAQFIQWCYANNRTDILSRIVCVATYGNPQRLAGFASGNEFTGWPLPPNDTGGIAQKTNPNGPCNLTFEQVQPRLPNPVTHFWGEFVNTATSDGGASELYANAPQNDAGTVEQSIFNAVQNLDVQTAIGVLLDLQYPIGIGMAILNGFEFLAEGQNADHYNYDPQAIYNFVSLAGSETPPFGPI